MFFSYSGPGCSSLGVGAFSENGPFRPNGEFLTRNEYSWNKGTLFLGTFRSIYQNGFINEAHTPDTTQTHTSVLI